MSTNARTASRFSIAALLLLTAAVAGYLAGHERGYDQGQKQWQTMPETTRLYFVGDISQLNQETSINSHQIKPTLDEIALTIEKEIIPSNWKRNSVDLISPDARKRELIVTGNSLVHAEVANYLAYLRRENTARPYGVADLTGNE